MVKDGIRLLKVSEGEPPSKDRCCMNDKLEELLGKVFDKVREHALPENVDPAQYDNWKRDFIFHLTDWTSDIDRLRGLFQNPESFNVDTASKLIVSFLIHVIPHLNMAGRLVLDEISDPFLAQGKQSKERN